MNKICTALLLMAIIFSQSVLADDTGNAMSYTKNKSCEILAKACSKAGFVRTEKPGKRFWFDCMKPLLLGQSVKKLVPDPEVVKSCKEYKMDELKKELQELQSS